jgi:hypothetical protein
MEQKRDPGLIARLFDLGFTHFIALSLIRIVYVMLMVAGLVVFAILIYYQFQMGEQHAALLMLVLAPFINLAYLFILRLICETLILAFSMAENLSAIRAALEQAADKETRAPE